MGCIRREYIKRGEDYFRDVIILQLHTMNDMGEGGYEFAKNGKEKTVLSIFMNGL